MTKIKNVEAFLRRRARQDESYARLLGRPPVLRADQLGPTPSVLSVEGVGVDFWVNFDYSASQSVSPVDVGLRVDWVDLPGLGRHAPAARLRELSVRNYTVVEVPAVGLAA